MYIAIDQEKGNKNYQSACKDKLGKTIPSSLSTDETAAIVKHLDHAIKFQDDFVVLEEEALTNTTQLPQSLTKTQQFFHRSKPKPNGIRACASMCVLHTVEIQDIIGDLRHALKVEGTL